MSHVWLREKDNKSGGEWKGQRLSCEVELTLLALIHFLCILSQLTLSIRAATNHAPFKTLTNFFVCVQFDFKRAF